MTAARPQLAPLDLIETVSRCTPLSLNPGRYGLVLDVRESEGGEVCIVLDIGGRKFEVYADPKTLGRARIEVWRRAKGHRFVVRRASALNL